MLGCSSLNFATISFMTSMLTLSQLFQKVSFTGPCATAVSVPGAAPAAVSAGAVVAAGGTAWQAPSSSAATVRSAIVSEVNDRNLIVRYSFRSEQYKDGKWLKLQLNRFS